MILDIWLLAFVLSLLRGGRFRNLARVQINRIWLAFVPVILIAIIEVMRARGLEAVAYKISGPFHILSMFPILALLWFNRKISGTLLIAFGVFLNMFPIAFNGGKMPVSKPVAMSIDMPDHMADYLNGKPMVRHCIMNDKTRFKWLSDVIPAPKPPFYIAPGVVSPGDVVLNLGMCLFIGALMGVSFRKPVNEQTS